MEAYMEKPNRGFQILGGVLFLAPVLSALVGGLGETLHFYDDLFLLFGDILGFLLRIGLMSVGIYMMVMYDKGDRDKKRRGFWIAILRFWGFVLFFLGFFTLILSQVEVELVAFNSLDRLTDTQAIFVRLAMMTIGLVMAAATSKNFAGEDKVANSKS